MKTLKLLSTLCGAAIWILVCLVIGCILTGVFIGFGLLPDAKELIPYGLIFTMAAIIVTVIKSFIDAYVKE